MYLRIDDFITDWREEAESTLKVFSKIPDELLTTKDDENIRSLGRMAWHITQTLTEMPASCGILDQDPLEHKPVPASFSEISSLYRNHSDQLLKIIQGKWSDEDLRQTFKIYGQEWEGRKILSALVKHQIHHRAQMTILMRKYDLPVPGIYGPSKEEWSNYGMEPQE